MEVKFIEIRDRATFIPAMAVRFSESDSWLIRRAGYGGSDNVILTYLSTGESQCDPYDWRNPRTMGTVHHYLIREWDRVPNEGMIDVRVILGEESENVISEKRIFDGL